AFHSLDIGRFVVGGWWMADGRWLIAIGQRLTATSDLPTTALPLFLPRPFDALIDGLAAGEAFFGRMPVGDFLFAKFPAEQENFSFDLAGEIQQSDIYVLDLHSGGVNFSDRIFGALDGAFPFGLAA